MTESADEYWKRQRELYESKKFTITDNTYVPSPDLCMDRATQPSLKDLEMALSTLSLGQMQVVAKKEEVFSFEQKLTIDGLKARGYTEDEIVDFVFAARTHGTTIALVVERFEKARADVKEYLTPEPASTA